MAEPVRARQLSDEEGRRLLRIVRRGKHGSVRVRRAVIIMASASGTRVSAIALLVAADEDPDRCFAFDQFGPLSIRPCHGACWRGPAPGATAMTCSYGRRQPATSPQE